MDTEIIKSTVRRFLRVFVSTFGVAFFGFMELFSGWDILKDSFMVSPEVGFQALWGVLVYPAIFAGLSAGINAVGKMVRELLREKGMEEVANKIAF